MGSTIYNTHARSMRSASLGYKTVTVDSMNSVFSQKKLKVAHEQMIPKNIKRIIEARDSDVHPKTVTVQLYLDVTGSMLGIPVYLISEGLPHIMEKLEAAGVKDVALLIGAIGDHECDSYPIQLGQFESGDAELDMWLTRIYPEGGGGDNSGESYGLAWYNAAFHVETDQYSKRKEKGFVFTIGDEPTLLNYPSSAIKEIYGDNAAQVNNSYTAQELYELCSAKNHVFHIHVNHASSSRTNINQILGQNCLVTKNKEDIADLIVNTIVSNLKLNEQVVTESNIDASQPTEDHQTNDPDFKITL